MKKSLIQILIIIVSVFILSSVEARTKNVNGVDVPLTPQQELDRDSEEAARLADLPNRKLKRLKARRERLLRASDKTQLLDFSGTKQKQTEWATYRQQLRGMTFPDLDNVVWPQEPSP